MNVQPIRTIAFATLLLLSHNQFGILFNGQATAAETLCDNNFCACEPHSRIREHIAPSMFGDGGLVIPRALVLQGGLQLVVQNHAYKISENNSVLPQDRVGFNFNAMQDVYNGISDRLVSDNIYEYRFFLEETFMDGRLSFELMVPFYSTSSYSPDPLVSVNRGPAIENEFGDIAFGLKALVHETHSSACSIGLRVEVPTGAEVKADPALNGAGYIASLDDDVWNFTPYLGYFAMPTERTYLQAFTGYRLTSTSVDEIENPLSIREQSYFTADLALGCWLYRNSDASFLTSVIPSIELHYTGAWDTESANRPGLGPANTISNLIYGHSDRLSLTAGCSAVTKSSWEAGLGVAVPLRTNDANFSGFTVPSDRAYDWSLLARITYHFGP